MRDGDTVARLGGDEFTVILEGISSPDDAATVARKIIDTLAPPFLLGKSEVFVTTSIGISIFPLDSTDLDILLKNTDTAMYSAKETGRNNFQFFTQALNARTHGRLEMESDLRHALERGEFVIYYQPKVSLSGGEAMGMEALIRWDHPKRGIVTPDEFIPILEDTGLINPVGRWLLQTACSQTKRWLDRGLPPMRIAVNVSPRQFLHNDLVADVTHALKTSRLKADWLELEITESLLMQNPDYAASVMEKIRSLGMLRINIDDFGTGYSSLGYLKRFPIHTVKIDASFVRDILIDKEDSAIVQAVIAMSHSLDLKVIAEGVETWEQYELLRVLGCDAIQGYLVGRPMPAHDFERWVGAHAAAWPPPLRVVNNSGN
jgi:EAL domain-containing protein (putative c-di-GMP-specific phosphodiesterase class I)